MSKSLHTVETPIGSLLFSICAADGDIGGARISECDIEPNIPKGMSVEGCKAVLLRCISQIPLKDIVFSCSWNELKGAGYGNSGEGLDAWEWVKLKESSSSYYPITMNNNAIKIHISEFPANSELSLHFVISWNSIPEKVDSSCWYAVDVPHKRVLQKCN